MLRSASKSNLSRRKNMKLTKITKSDMLSQAGYDDKTERLQLRFKGNNALYTYFNVPQSIFDRLMKSKRKGTFVKNNIRMSFSYRKGSSRKLMIPIKGYTQIRNGKRIKVKPYIKTLSK